MKHSAHRYAFEGFDDSFALIVWNDEFGGWHFVLGIDRKMIDIGYASTFEEAQTRGLESLITHAEDLIDRLREATAKVKEFLTDTGPCRE